MPKLTLEQKRRETLRRQLYGREVIGKSSVISPQSSEKHKTESGKTFSLADYESPTAQSELATTNFLAHDLSKVLIFTVVALAVQFSLFFLMQHNFVKLPF